MTASRSEIGELWRAVNREIHDRFRQAFRGSGMPFVALIFLRQISEQPGVTVSELARVTGMVKSHVSKTVEQLVRQGYVEKRSDPADQRLLRVYLTQSAVDYKANMEAQAMAAWSGVLDEVPEDQLTDVARGLRILLGALEKSKGRVNADL